MDVGSRVGVGAGTGVGVEVGTGVNVGAGVGVGAGTAVNVALDIASIVALMPVETVASMSGVGVKVGEGIAALTAASTVAPISGGGACWQAVSVTTQHASSAKRIRNRNPSPLRL